MDKGKDDNNDGNRIMLVISCWTDKYNLHISASRQVCGASGKQLDTYLLWCEAKSYCDTRNRANPPSPHSQTQSLFFRSDLCVCERNRGFISVEDAECDRVIVVRYALRGFEIKVHVQTQNADKREKFFCIWM